MERGSGQRALRQLAVGGGDQTIPQIGNALWRPMRPDAADRGNKTQGQRAPGKARIAMRMATKYNAWPVRLQYAQGHFDEGNTPRWRRPLKLRMRCSSVACMRARAHARTHEYNIIYID